MSRLRFDVATKDDDDDDDDDESFVRRKCAISNRPIIQHDVVFV